MVENHNTSDRIIHLYHEWYFSEMQGGFQLNVNIQEMVDRLNDDCILMVLQYSNLIDFLHLARFNDRLLQLAKQRKIVEIVPAVLERPIGLMSIRYLLSILGDDLTSLTISMNSMHSEVFGGHSVFLKCATIYCIQKYTGSQLRDLTLKGFEIAEDMDSIHFLLSKLRNRGVDLILLE